MASHEEIQFRCKLCQFMALSKQQIADHFVDTHAAVEIIGVGGPLPAPPSQRADDAADHNVDDDNGTVEETGSSSSGESQAGTTDKLPSKKKDGFRSNAIRSTISHLVRAAEQASKHDWTTSAGTSRRLQKNISKTVPAVGRELRKHKMKRKFEDFEVLDDEHAKSKQAKPSSAKGRKVKGDPQHSAGSKSQKKTKPGKEDRGISTLSISQTEFKQKVDKELQLWLDKWWENHQAKMETCESNGCGLHLSSAEMKLHNRCHMQTFYGFRCPHCEYMHSRWRNMRCHIYKDHNGLEKPLLRCDWPGCSTFVTNLWGLKRHVLRDHIRRKVTRMSTPGQEESTAKTEEHTVKIEDMPDLEKTKGEADCYIAKRRSKARRKKKGIEGADADNQQEEAVKKIYKRKKPNKVAWLPSCSVCEAKYIAVENMDVHMALHIVEGSDHVKCSECGILVDDKSKLKAHMNDLHKRLLKVYRCDKCKYAGDRHHDFRKHLITHEDSKPCMCEVCGKLMSTAYNLKVHLLRVHATEAQKTIQCAHCSYRCADNIVLKDHMRFQHNLLWNGDPYRDIEKLQTFRCNKCSYVGRKEKSLKYHMRVHTENRQFHCTICSYASKTKNNLILHMRTHGGLKPIKCPQCDYRGATNKVVNEHVLSKHKGVRPFRCPCGWSTAYSGNMWKHMQEHRQKADAFKDIAVERYGGQKTKKKKRATSDAQSSQVQQVVTVVHEFSGQGSEIQLSSDSQQPSRVISFTEGSLSEKDIPGSSKFSQVAVLPIMGGELQLDNLVQAVGVAAAATADKDGNQTVVNQQRQQLQVQQDSQAADFLCKLAHAVSTGQPQVLKQVPESKGLQLECEVQASDGSVEQTIQELILW